jgi:hypothetical protein
VWFVSISRKGEFFFWKLNSSDIVGQKVFSRLNGGVLHFVCDSQMMANVHGQKIVIVVNYIS